MIEEMEKPGLVKSKNKGSINNDNYEVTKVSAKAIICVPVYNEDRYLEDTLNSLHKTPEGLDVKFFIADNKSTDRTFEIVKSFAEKDSRFVIHQHERNLGSVENFLYLYQNSDSPYIMCLGGHDQIDPGYIPKAIELFDKHDDAAYVAAEPYSFTDNIESAVLMQQAKYDFSEHQLVRYMQSVNSLANCTIVNSMFRRKFVDDIEFRPTLGNDHILISHLLWYGKIYYTENENYYRRFFTEERGTTDERITGITNTKLDHFSFIQYYIDDFKVLHNQPGEMQDYLCQKILLILEKRFGLESFIQT